MNLADKLTIPAHVIAREVGTETVILNLESGVYFGLDQAGARIWQLMSEGRTLTEICDALQEIYEVSRYDIERDVVALAENLLVQHLVTL